uniref:Uncharacterized protein n=1 Tax=Rhizophora mucronata TaxID=61149 RepID=A0A2P2PXS5_RHIMU
MKCCVLFRSGISSSCSLFCFFSFLLNALKIVLILTLFDAVLNLFI